MISLLTFGHLVVFVFLIAYRGTRTRSRALDYFIVARLFHGIGWLLISQRGMWPDILTAFVANPVLMFGVAAESIAFITYRERSRLVERVFLGLAAMLTIIFLLFARTPPFILAFASAAAFLLELPTAVIILKRSRQSVLLRVVGTLRGLASLSLLVRSFAGFLAILDYRVTQGRLQASFYVPVFAVLLAGGTAMALLLKEVDERSLRESYETYDTLFRSIPSAVVLSDPETGFVLDTIPNAWI